jgi:hypothetical protein
LGKNWNSKKWTFSRKNRVQFLKKNL